MFREDGRGGASRQTDYPLQNEKAEGLLIMGFVETRLGPRGKTMVMLAKLVRLIAEDAIEPPRAIAK